MPEPVSLSALRAAGPAAEPVRAALRQAGARAGASFSYLVELARRESGFDPMAQAGTSSAAGLFQFIEETWLTTVKRYGAQSGLGAYADRIETRDGRCVVDDPAARREILDLRLDPAAAAAMAAASTAENRTVLQAKLGRAVDDRELYLAHFLGAGGAAKLLGADPRADAAALFPAAAKANPTLFYEANGPRSAAALIEKLTASFEGKAPQADDPPAPGAFPAERTAAPHAPARPDRAYRVIEAAPGAAMAGPAWNARVLALSLDILDLVDPGFAAGENDHRGEERSGGDR